MSSAGEYRVMFWNARGVRNKYLELIDLIQTDEIDISCINETFLDDNLSLPNTNGYNIVRLDKSNHSGGLLFIIKNSISFSVIDYQLTQLFEVGVVKINAMTPFLLYLVYCPGGTADQARISSHFESELRSMCTGNVPFFVLGDFNAKHRSWNCTRNNKSGKLLFELVRNNRWFLNNPDTHSYNPASVRMTPSTIDLMITDGKLPSSPLYTVEKLSSDHYPIQFEINSLKGPAATKTIFDFSRANWNGFGAHISLLLNPTLERYNSGMHITNSEIDLIVAEITDSLLIAQELNVPKINTNSNNNATFIPTPLLRTLITDRNFFRRKVTRTHNSIFKFLYNEFKRRVELEIKNIQNNKFLRILVDCNEQHNKIYKVIKNRRHVNLPNLNPMVPGDRKHVSPLSKAEAIAGNFLNNHTNHLVGAHVTHTRMVNNSVKSLLNSPPRDPTECPIIDVNEVATTIRKLKNNKAGGLDGINTRLLKKLPPVAIHLITLVFTVCIRNAYFPKSWKIAKTIPIPKPGKDRKNISSYRPIALLTCLGKLFERVIHSRLYGDGRSRLYTRLPIWF